MTVENPTQGNSYQKQIEEMRAHVIELREARKQEEAEFQASGKLFRHEEEFAMAISALTGLEMLETFTI